MVSLIRFKRKMCWKERPTRGSSHSGKNAKEFQSWSDEACNLCLLCKMEVANVDEFGREHFGVDAAPGPLGISLGENELGFVVVRGIDECLSSKDLNEEFKTRVNLVRQVVALGDRLVAIEGDDVVHCDLTEIITRLGKLASKKRLLVFARYHPTQYGVKNYDVEKLLLVRAPSGPLGLILSDVVTYGAVIESFQRLPDGSESHLRKDRKVYRGCQIVSINGTDVSGLSREAVTDLLTNMKEQEKEIILYRMVPCTCATFSRLEYPSAEHEALGFSLDDSDKFRCVVTSVDIQIVDDAVAIGDILVGVNGIDITTMSLQKATEMLHQAPFPRVLHFCRSESRILPECRYLRIDSGPSGLNLDNNHPNHARITGFTTAEDAGRLAFKNCTEFIPGSYIITINGLDVYQHSLSDISNFLLKLRNAPKEIVVGNESLMALLKQTRASAAIEVPAGPLGIQFGGGRDDVTRVSGFNPLANGQPGAIEQSRRIPVGSTLQNINKMNVSCLTLAQATDLLKKLSTIPKELVFSSPATPHDANSRTVDVRVLPGPLGVDLKSSLTGKVVVDRLNQDAACGPTRIFDHGGVVIGSELLAIDGFDVSSLQIAEVANLLRLLASYEKSITFSTTTVAYNDMLSPARRPTLKRVVVTQSPMGIQFDSTLTQEAIISGYSVSTSSSESTSPRELVEGEIPVGSRLIAIDSIDIQALSLQEIASILKSFAGIEKTLTFDTAYCKASEIVSPQLSPTTSSSPTGNEESMKSAASLSVNSAVTSPPPLTDCGNLSLAKDSGMPLPVQPPSASLALFKCLQISPSKPSSPRATKEDSSISISFADIMSLKSGKQKAGNLAVSMKKGRFRLQSSKRDLMERIIVITTNTSNSVKKKSKTWELGMRSGAECNELEAILTSMIPELQRVRERDRDVMSGDDAEFVGVFAGDDEDTPGQETPIGFRDTVGQWYMANHRKRCASQTVDGEPTQRDSQATEAVTQVESGVPPQPTESAAPVFVAALPSFESDSGSNHLQHGEDEVDEEETQIRMSMSEDQEDGVRSLTKSGESTAGNSEEDADSDMSDDMLEQDGPTVGLSSIAASFQQREGLEKQEAIKRKAAVHVYKPRGPFQVSPAVSVREDSNSSGDETEIEGEPDGESTRKKNGGRGDALTAKAGMPRGLKDGSPLRLVKSSSYAKPTARQEIAMAGKGFLQRSKSTPDRAQSPDTTKLSSKRDLDDAPRSAPARKKRFRFDKESSPSDDLGHETPVDLPESPTKDKTGLLAKQTSRASILSESKGGSGDAVEMETLGLPAGTDDAAVAQKASASCPLPRPRDISLASTPNRKRAASGRSIEESESAGSQAEGTMIRVILTGLEPTAVIRKKIKAIGGAVYESSIEKATHVIAPQNQVKRTVKLLCGISCCAHVLDERWLDESARLGAAVDEQAHCLHDGKAEAKWQFDLRRTMYEVPSETRKQLFAGYHVFITNHKSVLPPVKDLAKIVECAGGTAELTGKPGPDDLVITSEAALAVATVQKQIAQANPERIYSPELILSSILQQRIDLGRHQLERPTIGKTWATRRRK
ncbi:hypothetical protein BBJ28_00013084 [Nothophytophthora sp. Chile5]|nr:hypothetical protein BBJ28_00013084 [Nothophytophthora sp. Chile5]